MSNVLNTKAGTMAIGLLMSDDDIRLVLKWRSLYQTHGGLDNMHPSMFSRAELKRLDRLNDLGLLTE